MDDNAVMAVLKNSRKARKQTTCYPCQRRKVKCDRGLPCRVCVSRGHSFLCSYGRPAESSKTIPSITSGGPEDGSRLQDSEPQLSALRKQLNHLHQELHEARKRHRQCEEAEVQVRRLQARCREYEAVHVSLRAGDWSALARINGTIESDSDTSSVTPEGSECSQDARLRDDRVLAPLVDVSQATDVSSSASTVRSSTASLVNTVHPREPELYAVTPSAPTVWPARSILSGQQPRTSFGQSGAMPDLTTSCRSPRAIHGSDLSNRYKEAPECLLQPSSSSDPSNHKVAQHQIAGSHVQRTQAISSSISSENNRENSIAEFSVAPTFSSRQTNQQEQGGQALQAPSCIESSNMMLSHAKLGRTDIPSAVSWTQISLFPPMIFSQDLDLMERSYADYWAKIVIEAQPPILPAG